MNTAMVLDVGRETVMTLLVVSMPLMLAALVVGVVIGLLQALTSVQEVTLTFVPKIVVVFAIMLLVMPFMASRLQVFTQEVFTRMAQLDPTTNVGAMNEN
jgi:flagellar biosynthetic protein FliQ